GSIPPFRRPCGPPRSRLLPCQAGGGHSGHSALSTGLCPACAVRPPQTWSPASPRFAPPCRPTCRHEWACLLSLSGTPNTLPSTLFLLHHRDGVRRGRPP